MRAVTCALSHQCPRVLARTGGHRASCSAVPGPWISQLVGSEGKQELGPLPPQAVLAQCIWDPQSPGAKGKGVLGGLSSTGHRGLGLFSGHPSHGRMVCKVSD